MTRHWPVEVPGWPRPKGYNNGVLAAPGRLLFVAGQIGWDEREKLVSELFLPQFRRALENVVAVVRAAGGAADDVCRVTIYVKDKAQYTADLKAVGLAYREVMGRTWPAMSLVEVRDLLEPGALVEIEATAVIASSGGAP
jgi:enamine deaminase RidA (YjgF/YER057c/UK114 family)